MPVLFTGHLDNVNEETQPFIESLRTFGTTIKPAVILVISAHWLTLGGSFIQANKSFHVPEYPSTGAPETANYVADHTGVQLHQRELDHGAWMVLKHIAPNGDIPVLQLSIDMEQPLDYHYRLARQLAPLRDMGVLIIGSGNVVHNLELSALRFWTKKPYSWAEDFDQWVKQRIDARDFSSLFRYNTAGKSARLAVPTADHYIPLLYALSLMNQQEEITHTYEQVFRGLSLRSMRIG
ncbi:MAG TPA: class III extradiol ring-cleavage dioxygenase [Chitinophagaceae bacterium]|nr:class III extradiol ring-cleavage dioxygenase [Chitinophagaceae bacterium]